MSLIQALNVGVGNEERSEVQGASTEGIHNGRARILRLFHMVKVRELGQPGRICTDDRIGEGSQLLLEKTFQ